MGNRLLEGEMMARAAVAEWVRAWGGDVLAPRGLAESFREAVGWEKVESGLGGGALAVTLDLLLS